jgi:hypothetical protein
MPLYELVLCGVDVRRRLRQRRVKTQRLRQMQEAVDVARQTRASVRSASTQQTRSDARIKRQRVGHAIEIGAAKPIVQLSQKISERYLQTEKRVESDLRELGASPAFEFVRRLQAHAIEVAVFDPLAAAREAARAIFGPTITSCDTLDESLRRADVILVCNPDPDFVAISAAIPADRHIVDPWGCVRGPHPGLKRPGRLPLREAGDDHAQLIHTSSVVR